MPPLDVGSGWIRTVGRLDPLTYVADTTSSLFACTIADVAVLRGWTFALMLAFAGLWLGAPCHEDSACQAHDR